ncbi:hypothetical protein F5Y17DRAFT_420039 [Xylariaceae sp. FL0594]|nr:hypothetical protein F5Y17DRAFT_420039 [Xylariaceae sp. FL0594]
MLTPRYLSAQQNPNAYLAAPPVQPPPSGRSAQRNHVYGRPASSVYSQPSPEAAVFAAHKLRADMDRPDPLEISPPSSPDIASPREGPYPGDVSPIDESPDVSQFIKQTHPAVSTRTEPRSNIPQMRRERRKNSDAAMQSFLEAKSRERASPPRSYGHDARWGPRAGETTEGIKGRPYQVRPQEFAPDHFGRHETPSPGPQDRPGVPNPSSFRDRLRPVRSSSASPQPEPAPRPEWRGASGRMPLVPPVRDNRHVAPLQIPPKNMKRGGRNFPVLSPVESTGGSDAAASPREGPLSPPPETVKGSQYQPSVPPVHPQSPNVLSSTQSNSRGSSYPTPPVSEDTVRVSRPPVHDQIVRPSLKPPPLQIATNEKAIRRKPARLSDQNQPEPLTALEYSEEGAPSQHPPTNEPPVQWTQPPSRFSITTYATSNHTLTPRLSFDDNVLPLPTSPQANTPTPAPKPVSILDRGRPIASGSPQLTPTEAVKITLDSPYYAPASTATTAAKPKHAVVQNIKLREMAEKNQSRLSVSSISSLEKSLPPAPPEVSAKDRVSELNAQLEALANRRININMAIRKMTEMMPTDNILASDAVVRKREAEKRKVETLRAELADVERQSYEIGLKLHRAYKRLDRDAEYEPTTLWVRRVTN